MSARLLTLALALSAAGAAIAQPVDAPPPPAPAPGPPATASTDDELPPAPAPPPHRPTSPLHRIPRITAELALGGASAALMAYGGAQLGCALYGSASTTACVQPAAYGALAGFVLGVPIGVMLGGAVLDGDGAFLPTVFGAGLGLAAMLGGLYFLQGGPLEANWVPLVALPISFAVVGYELTSHDSRAAAQAEARSRRASLLIAPSASATRGGVALGILIVLP